jgi:uncharacterized protein (TIGR03083 family)
MDPVRHVHVLEHDAARIAELTAASPEAPVPACPGWDTRALLAHVGGAHRWGTQVLAARGAPIERHLAQPPQGLTELLAWFGEGTRGLVAALRAAEPQDPAWTPVGRTGTTVWWSRKMAVETAVHRIDAEVAAGAQVTPVDPLLALDGIDELLEDFLGGLLLRHQDDRPTGTVHLHATDVVGEWWVDLDRIDGFRVEVRREHAKGDLALRGSASQLLLFLWNRLADPAAELEVFGDPQALGRFAALTI